MQSDDLGLVERIRAACVGHPHAKIGWPHRILHEAADDLAAKDAAIERLVAERDEALASKTAAIAARELASTILSNAEAQRDKLKETLQAMVQRFELYLGPDNIHAGHHDLALVERARQALKDAP